MYNLLVEYFPPCLLLDVFHHACCGMFSSKLGFVRFYTELVVAYLTTRLFVDWFPQAQSDYPTTVNLAPDTFQEFVGGWCVDWGLDIVFSVHLLSEALALVWTKFNNDELEKYDEIYCRTKLVNMHNTEYLLNPLKSVPNNGHPHTQQ